MIWRRFLIQGNKTLKDLHYVIQILMGGTDYHLNEFIIKGKRYTIPNSIGYPSSNGEYGTLIPEPLIAISTICSFTPGLDALLIYSS